MPAEIRVGGPKTERKRYKQTEPKISHGRSGRQVVYRFWPKTQLLNVYISIECTQTGIQKSQYLELTTHNTNQKLFGDETSFGLLSTVIYLLTK